MRDEIDLRAEITKARDMATQARDACARLGDGMGVSDNVFKLLEAGIFGLLLSYKKAITYNIGIADNVELCVWRVITLEKMLDTVELLPDVVADPIENEYLKAEIDKAWKEVQKKTR
jgi:hypothetical protein